MSWHIDSKYARGFPRWERARVNALIQPDSPGAKLYQSRVAFANMVIKGGAAPRHTAFYHLVNGETKVNYRVCGPFCAAMQLQLEHGIVNGPLTVASVLNTLSEAFIQGVYRDRYTWTDGYKSVKVLGFELPKRKVKCHACWQVIHPNGDVTSRVDTSDVIEELWEKEKKFKYDTLLGEPEPLLGVVPPSPEVQQMSTPQGELFAITMDGKLQPLSDVAVVRLTQDQYDMLMQYSTDELRVQYGQDHTLWLDGDSFVNGLK